MIWFEKGWSEVGGCWNRGRNLTSDKLSDDAVGEGLDEAGGEERGKK